MYSLVRATAARKSFFAVRYLTLSLPGLRVFRVRRSGSGSVEALFQLVEALDGAIVGGRGIAARDIGRDHEPDLLAHMIEGQHLVEEEQAGVGNAELVFGARGQALDLAHGVVGEEADCAGGERGQARQARGLVAAERVAQHGEDVALECAGGLAALGDGDVAAARHDALERREADEGIAAHLLAALDGFQEKALALGARPRAGRPRPGFPGRP